MALLDGKALAKQLHEEVKTGTLASASCLAGYVEGRTGRLAFTILLGQGSANGWGWGPPLRERLYEVIAEAVR